MVLGVCDFVFIAGFNSGCYWFGCVEGVVLLLLLRYDLTTIKRRGPGVFFSGGAVSLKVVPSRGAPYIDIGFVFSGGKGAPLIVCSMGTSYNYAIPA